MIYVYGQIRNKGSQGVVMEGVTVYGHPPESRKSVTTFMYCFIRSPNRQ